MWRIWFSFKGVSGVWSSSNGATGFNGVDESGLLTLLSLGEIANCPLWVVKNCISSQKKIERSKCVRKPDFLTVNFFIRAFKAKFKF